ncbi:MAG: chemotaxis protein CheW [Candidatus Coatesbacteria bacterium]
MSSPDSARTREIMEERARRLARPAAEVRGSGDTLEIVVFGLASERYAVENRYVREVVRLADLAPVPGAPEFMAGVTNLRGEILAVVDLRRFFGVPARGITDTSRVVVLGADEAEFGVLADAVGEVVSVRPEEILDPLAPAGGVGGEYLRGVTKDGLIVLDGAALLASPRLVVEQ